MSLSKSDLKKFAKFSECACFNIRKSSRAITRFYEEKMKESGLTANQFSILVLASMDISTGLTHLSNIMVLERTTLTRNLKPLELKGYVKIVQGENKRRKIVNVTAAGRKVLDKAMPLWEKAQAEIVRWMGKKEMKGLLSELLKVREATQ